MDSSTVASFVAGASRAEITPPLDVGILMSSVEKRWAPFEGVRKPLYGRTVVVEGSGSRVALVALDLLGLANDEVGGYAAFKQRIVAASQGAVAADDLILTSTHSHSAPASLGLTDLADTPQFQGWIDQMARRIGAALRDAVDRGRPCRLRVGATEVAGLSVYRRIRTTSGIVLSHPPPAPGTVIAARGPVDNGVRVAALVDEATGAPLALIVNATCHPVYEMCIPQVSPDYPGEMSAALEARYPGVTALFLNGAAGNINPPSVSSGADEAIRHGQRLAQAVSGLMDDLHPAVGDQVVVVRRTLALPRRTLEGLPTSAPLWAGLAGLRLGDAAFVFLPGEPFVETGLALYAASPCAFTVVAGYAEDWIGYLPTDEAFDEGGYEIGPGAWSVMGRGGEAMVCKTGIQILQELCPA